MVERIIMNRKYHTAVGSVTLTSDKVLDFYCCETNDYKHNSLNSTQLCTPSCVGLKSGCSITGVSEIKVWLAGTQDSVCVCVCVCGAGV
jgi:hypothetical protein